MNESIKRTIEELEAFMATREDALALPRAGAEFTYALVRARGVRRAVEIGTSYGYSGLWIAAGLASGGRMVTIDQNPGKSEAARANFERAGVLERIDVRTGRAGELLAGVEGPIDFVLIDADKEGCIAYLQSLLGKLSPGAVVLTDNTLTHSAELKPYQQWVRSRPEFFAVDVPIGNGMDMAVKTI